MIDATVEIHYWTKNKESLETLTRNLLKINAEVTPEVFSLLTKYEAIKEDLHYYLLHEDRNSSLFQLFFRDEICDTIDKVAEILSKLTELVGMHKVLCPVHYYPVVVFVPTDENPIISSVEEDYDNDYYI